MNIVVAQSGGPTCAINASLLGVMREAMKVEKIDAIFGSINGIEGAIDDRLIDLKTMFRTDNDMDLLRQTPSTVLGSCRYKLADADKDDTVYKKITQCFIRRQIGAFFYIGGNDSMDTVNKLSAYIVKEGLDIKIIGIPKTIDNDLCITDHTPGFGSAAKYVAVTMQEIIRDSAVYSMPSITIVEIMGRHAGWLTASSAILHANNQVAPHLIYVPERSMTLSRFFDDLRCQMAKHQAVVVAVSEGTTVKEAEEGEYQSGEVDNFGHRYLSGIGKFLEHAVRKEFGCKVRSIELNVMQRCSSHIASATDIREAEEIGAAGVRCALKGETGKVMVFRRVRDVPYTVVIESAPVESVANREKHLPSSYINESGNNITEKALSYFMPLIQGEPDIIMKNGIPEHFLIRDDILR